MSSSDRISIEFESLRAVSQVSADSEDGDVTRRTLQRVIGHFISFLPAPHRNPSSRPISMPQRSGLVCGFEEL